MVTHWSNAFGFRRRVRATADEAGKPAVLVPAELLELIGLKPGEEIIASVCDGTGVIAITRPEVQIPEKG